MKLLNSSKALLGDRILFGGSYGKMNTGDDVFCAVLSWGAQKYWDTKHINFLGHNLPKLPVNARAVLSEKTAYSKYLRFLETSFEAAKTPILIFGGGSLFRHGRGKQRFVFRQLQRFGRFKMGAIGVSLGPYYNKNDRKELERFVLRKLSFLVLRDRHSYEDALSMNLPYKPIEGFDLAAMMPEIYGPAKPQNSTSLIKKPILGVNICRWESLEGMNIEMEQRRQQRITESLIKVAQNNDIIIRFLLFNGSQDRSDLETIKKIAPALKGYSKIEICDYSNNPVDMWHQIGQCSAILATRLHVGILSCFAEVPFIQVEYHQKCSNFIDTIGYPEQWRVGDMDISGSEVALKLSNLLNGQKFSFASDLKSLRNKAELNFTSPLAIGNL